MSTIVFQDKQKQDIMQIFVALLEMGFSCDDNTR
jgi:hypothetical protein